MPLMPVRVKHYGNTLPNLDYWTEEVASDFVRVDTWYQGADPASTEINGSTSNDNGKTWFPDARQTQPRREDANKDRDSHEDISTVIACTCQKRMRRQLTAHANGVAVEQLLHDNSKRRHPEGY